MLHEQGKHIKALISYCCNSGIKAGFVCSAGMQVEDKTSYLLAVIQQHCHHTFTKLQGKCFRTYQDVEHVSALTLR